MIRNRSVALQRGVAFSTALLLASALALSCATRADEPDGGTPPARDGGAARDGGSTDGGGSDGGTAQDGGTPRDGGFPGTDTTITNLQTNVHTPGTCVRVQAVAMSVVYSDRDDNMLLPNDGGRINRKAFYISEKGLTTTAARTGIVVTVNPEVPDPTVAPGDDVTIEAAYNENFANSTLRVTVDCGSITKNGTAAVPAAMDVTLSQVGQTGSTGAFVDTATAEDFEGVLVKVTAGSVSQARDMFGNFVISDGTGSVEVLPTFGVTVAPAIGAAINSTGVTGFSHYSFNRRKLRPRTNAQVGIDVATANCGNAPKADHLLITEVRIGPTVGEFIEIHNPTAAAIDLSDYYLYNATFTPNTDGGVSDGGTSSPTRYYNTPSGTQGGTTFSDFALRFPAGASIGAGAYKIVALGSAAGYCTLTSLPCATAAGKPDWEIPPAAGCTAGTDDATVDNMRGNWDQSPTVTCGADGGLGGFGYLTSSSEEVVLFKWTMGDATVKDVDYFIWGTSTGVRTDKTGVAGYQADTAIGSQRPASGAPSNNQSFQRVCMNEGSQVRTGGNGISGGNETSENLDVTFIIGDPTPKAATPGATP